MATVQDKAASDDTALEEVCCHKNNLCKTREGWGSKMNTHAYFAVFKRIQKENLNSPKQPKRWGQIIIKAAEPESWYSVRYVLEGEDTDSSRPSNLQENKSLERNASASTGIINIYVCLQDSINSK